MRIFVALLWICFAFAPKAIAYPQDQLQECILSAKANPSILGTPEKTIEDFCDCALTAILDDGKDADSSANQCVRKHFRWADLVFDLWFIGFFMIIWLEEFFWKLILSLIFPGMDSLENFF